MEKQLNKYIDHTLLRADATEAEILAVCEEAKELDTASVCVNSCWARTVRKALEGTTVKTCCVVGFPLGAMSPAAKAWETRIACEDGAQEIDMVINIGRAKMGDWDYVKADIRAVVEAAEESNAVVKVILENCLLTDEEKIQACIASRDAGADFVKTSTGFSKSGATAEDVALMRKAVGRDCEVKAAGGIRDRETALKMIEAGADRIGASATKKILGIG
ncbi:MAG: deoxyribose-phosphate aldolase [Clostridia bacterium]|nr:deoxyribose-phosphate aldolase [Clostridia bacterium]